jgi:hypothetical protein
LSLDMVNLQGVCIICATNTPMNGWVPLQPFPWRLLDPVHPIVIEGEPRGCTGESQGPPGFTNPLQTPPSAPHTGHLQTQKILVRNLSDILTVPFTHTHSHTRYLLFSTNHLLKLNKENPAQPQLHGECSVFSADHWKGSAGNPG